MYFNLLKIAFTFSLINVSVFQITLCENFNKSMTIPDIEAHEKNAVFSKT